MADKCNCAVYYRRISDRECIGEKFYAYQKRMALQLLSHAFSDFFQVEWQEECMRRDEYGKPYYDSAENYYFNISHCKNAVVVAVAEHPVGVDVEGVRRVKCRTVEKCCSAREKEYVYETMAARNANEDLTEEEMRRFLRLWTLKESYVKMTGEGLRTAVNTVCFDIPDFQKTDQNNLRKKMQQHETYLRIQEDLTMALAIQCDMTRDAKVIWIPLA